MANALTSTYTSCTDRRLSSLICLCAASLLFVQPHLASGAAHCITVSQSLEQCLVNVPTHAVSVQCPPNYYLRISAVAVYKSASMCQSTPESNAARCWHSNVTSVNCPDDDSSCVLPVTVPASPLHCSAATYPGDYFALVEYHCQPVFRTDPNTTTAWTIYISSPAVRSGALVRVANNVFGPGGPSVYSTTDYCSLHVPRNAQAIVSVYTFFTTSPSPECQQRLELTQWNSSSTFQLCRSTSPITLDCPADDTDRYFTLRYVTDDPAIGTLFLIDFRVSERSAMTVQCGTPAVPLSVSQSTTTNAATTASAVVMTTDSGTATTSTTTTRTTTTSATTGAGGTVVDSTTVMTSVNNSVLIGIAVSAAVVAAIVIIAILVGLCIKRMRAEQQGEPVIRTEQLMRVGHVRPGNYVRQLSYIPKRPQNYEHFVDLYR